MILVRESYLSQSATRQGFVPIEDVSLGAPHFSDAQDLAKVLVGLDPYLKLGFIYDHMDHRRNRWAVVRFPPDGSQQIVRYVQDAEGNYQRPDQRVFLDLQKHKLDGRNGRKWIQDALNQDDRIEAEREKKREEERAELREAAQKHVRDIRFKGKQGQTVF